MRTAAERDHPAALVADRDHQPAAEPVIGLLALDLDQHAVSTSIGSPNSLSAAFSLPRLSGAKPMPNRRAVSAVMPRRSSSLRASTPPRAVELLDEPVRPLPPSPRAGPWRVRPWRRTGGPSPASPAPPLRQFLDRVDEGQAALVRHPADRVAMRGTAETVIEALVVVDVEAGRLLIVEGQQPRISRPAFCNLVVLPISADNEVRARNSSRRRAKDSLPIVPRYEGKSGGAQSGAR